MYITKEYPFYKFIQQQMDAHWTQDNISLSKDVAEKHKIVPSELQYLKKFFLYAVLAEGEINCNLLSNFIKEFRKYYKNNGTLNNEVNVIEAFFSIQANMEVIHALTYSNLLRAYSDNEYEISDIYTQVKNEPSFRKKTDWTSKWITNYTPTLDNLPVRLLAWGLIEGVFFATSFLIITKLRNKYPNLEGLSISNTYIMKDEAIHWKASAHLFKKYKFNEIFHFNLLKELTKEVLDIEYEFYANNTQDYDFGFSKEKVKDYIKLVIDVTIKEFGFEPIYNVSNPFPDLNIGIIEYTNFFESKEPKYVAPKSINVNIDKKKYSF